MHQVGLDWREGQPYSEMFDDVYFSRADGLAESEYVFLRNNGLPDAWRERDSFVIAETGFGTGLNFMLTATRWLETARPDAHLYYYSVEKYPLQRDDLQRVLSLYPQFSTIQDELFAAWPPAVHGFHCIKLFGHRITLVLMLGDVVDMLRQMSAQVDVWYLDGFAPARNPEMWRREVFVHMAQLSCANARFSTFTAAGEVRRALEEQGFDVEKVKGYGAKREMLRGCLRESGLRRELHPWFALPKYSFTSKRAAVIGAGIAGISTAWALAQRGWQVDIYEQSSQPAAAASGNPAGVLLPRIALEVSSEAEFYASAFFMAQQRLNQLQSRTDFSWQQSGVLQLLVSARLERQHDALDLPEDYVRCISASEASELAGVKLDYKALHFPQAGWLQPRELCQALLRDTPAVYCHYNTAITSLRRESDMWQLYAATGVAAEAEVVVLANAHHASVYQQSHWLSLQPARGQITQLSATARSRDLRCPVCYDGYVLPAMNNQHLTGATFASGNDSSEVLAEDHTHNMAQLARYLPEVFDVPHENLTGRAAVRAVTPDRMPLVGPVADVNFYRRHYADLQRGRAATQYPGAVSHAGLFVNCGHGARGLVSAFLSAELLAAQIEQHALPVSQDVMHALHPARFIIRAFRKGQSII
jgi:tRNA 5-methylaminomethyl-2-thiouridine biosynthesis bifunctional protein